MYSAIHGKPPTDFTGTERKEKKNTHCIYIKVDLFVLFINVLFFKNYMSLYSHKNIDHS